MRIRDRPDNSSNPVAPTVFRKKPFGENVEGLLRSISRLFSQVEPSSIRVDLESSGSDLFPSSCGARNI